MSGHAALSAPTVGAAVAAAATSHPTGLTAVGPSGVATNTSWAEVHHRACRAAAALRGLGAGPGDVVFVVGSVSSDLVAVIQGCLLAGATLSVLPTPWRVRTAAGYLAQVRAAIHTARPRLLVADEPARRALAELNHDVRLVDLAELVELPEPGQAPRSLPPRSPHQPVLLQFTSGSTSDPRAVVITEAQLLGHVEAISSAAGFRRGAETFVSWLPLYHDIGLIGFLLLPMLLGFDVVLADPTRFMQDPSTWMRCAPSTGPR